MARSAGLGLSRADVAALRKKFRGAARGRGLGGHRHVAQVRGTVRYVGPTGVQRLAAAVAVQPEPLQDAAAGRGR